MRNCILGIIAFPVGLFVTSQLILFIGGGIVAVRSFWQQIVTNRRK